MIANEIIKPYYFQRGGIIEQLKDDDDLQEAIKVLNDPAKYKDCLLYTSCPSDRQTLNAPQNTSPAPVVSIVSTSFAGIMVYSSFSFT